MKDTVQLLNEEDKQQSRRQLEFHHVDQLDDILARIQEIEREEDSMIHQGLALSYKIPGIACDLSKTVLHPDLSQVSAKSGQHDGVHLPHLTLPLEVVMKINIPDSDTGLLPHHELGDVTEGAVGTTAFNGNQFGLSELDTATLQKVVAETPVRTSILQGKRLQSIERRKHKFEHHRRLVESSLAETGMTQYAVIEMCVLRRIRGVTFATIDLTCCLFIADWRKCCWTT